MKQIAATSTLLLFFCLSVFAQEEKIELKKVKIKGDINTIISTAESYPDNAKAQLNAAAVYYNRGIAMVDSMDYNASEEKFRKVQDEVVTEFRNALVFATKSYELDPNNATLCEMLSGIYFGLNDMEKSKLFKERQLQLIGK